MFYEPYKTHHDFFLPVVINDQRITYNTSKFITAVLKDPDLDFSLHNVVFQKLENSKKINSIKDIAFNNVLVDVYMSYRNETIWIEIEPEKTISVSRASQLETKLTHLYFSNFYQGNIAWRMIDNRTDKANKLYIIYLMELITSSKLLEKYGITLTQHRIKNQDTKIELDYIFPESISEYYGVSHMVKHGTISIKFSYPITCTVEHKHMFYRNGCPDLGFSTMHEQYNPLLYSIIHDILNNTNVCSLLTPKQLKVINS